jgi:hypothetical protein
MYAVLKIFLCLVILLVDISIPVNAQTIGKSSFSRRNPDGWFSVDVPKLMGKVQRHADVDGGFYTSNEFEISYDYWAYKNTPHFLRDVSDRYSVKPLLLCTSKMTHIHTIHALISGKAAIIQQCVDKTDRTGLHNLYYVTFSRLRVYDGERFQNGMFSLTISYRDPKKRSLAIRVVRSIRFHR